jgi:hypothetical protein
VDCGWCCCLVAVFLAKEDTVSLAANGGADVASWIRILRFKEEPVLNRRPFNGRTRLDEVSSEVLRFIDNCRPANTVTAGDFPTPLNVKRHGGGDRSDWRYGRTGRGCSLPVRQGISKIVRIGNSETFRVHRGSCRIEFDFDAIGVQGHRPKEPAGRNSRGVVMDLLGCDGRSNRTGKDIHSNEPEDAFMQFTVCRDELSFHETHVGLKRQRIREPRTSPCTTDSVQSDETLEIRDLRRFAQID